VSYDLYLHPEAFSGDDVRAHFAARRNYQVSETQASYSNEDTGVYFSFYINEKPETLDEDDEEPRPPHIAFNINYFRPHIFGLEAEPELAAFLERFPSRIEDPQTEGMKAYSREDFLHAWNHGNRFGFHAMGRRNEGPPPWSADPAAIEAAWRWNFGRARLQNEKGDGVFVPKICWAQPESGAAPVPCITWTYGAPTVIPEALITHMALVRPKRPSLMKMFGLSSKRADKPEFDIRLIGVESGIRLRGLEPGEATGVRVLTTPRTNTLEIQNLFSEPWPEPKLVIVPPEQVCGADLVELIKGKS
jgi:hypothetical protein